MRIIRDRNPDRFTLLDNNVLENPLLSYRALGLYGYLAGRPNGWETDSRRLASRSPREGRDAVRTALKELQTVGLIRHEKRRDPATGRFSSAMIVTDLPGTDYPAPGERAPDEPTPDNPASLERTELNNTSPESPSTHIPRPQTAVGAEDIDQVNVAELAAELRVLRRDRDMPTARWTAPAVRRALHDAVAAGYELRTSVHALRVCAVDPATKQPGRLRGAGPWWDAQELAHLEERRTMRAQRAQNCPRCHGTGMEELDGDVVRRCDHEGAQTA